MSRHDDVIRLRHMLDHAREAVETAASRTRSDLDSDRMFQLAMRQLVEIVGEAADRVSAETQASLQEIPWSRVIGMRHRIIHGYDKVDLSLLWDTIVLDLPPLVGQLERAIARLEAESKP